MRPMRTLLSSLVLLALLGPGALAPGTLAAGDELPPLADVPLFRGDDRRTAVHPGPGPVSEPQLAWAVELDSETTSFPILVGGLLIVGTAGGDLVALDARTGEERWRAAGGGRFAGAPAADAGIVVAADPHRSVPSMPRPAPSAGSGTSSPRTPASRSLTASSTWAPSTAP